MLALDALTEGYITGQITKFISHVGGAGAALDTGAARDCWTEAWELTRTIVGDRPAPQLIIERATREVASELYARRNAPGGIMQSFGEYGGGTRLARDPRLGALPILAPYVPGGFS